MGSRSLAHARARTRAPTHSTNALPAHKQSEALYALELIGGGGFCTSLLSEQGFATLLDMACAQGAEARDGVGKQVPLFFAFYCYNLAKPTNLGAGFFSDLPPQALEVVLLCIKSMHSSVEPVVARSFAEGGQLAGVAQLVRSPNPRVATLAAALVAWAVMLAGPSLPLAAMLEMELGTFASVVGLEVQLSRQERHHQQPRATHLQKHAQHTKADQHTTSGAGGAGDAEKADQLTALGSALALLWAIKTILVNPQPLPQREPAAKGGKERDRGGAGSSPRRSPPPPQSRSPVSPRAASPAGGGPGLAQGEGLGLAPGLVNTVAIRSLQRLALGKQRRIAECAAGVLGLYACGSMADALVLVLDRSAVGTTGRLLTSTTATLT